MINLIKLMINCKKMIDKLNKIDKKLIKIVETWKPDEINKL